MIRIEKVAFAVDQLDPSIRQFIDNTLIRLTNTFAGIHQVKHYIRLVYGFPGPTYALAFNGVI